MEEAKPLKLSRPSHGTDLIKCVLLDIEGTTTPISFVKDILFTYIRNNLKKYLENHWEDDQCQEDVQALREQSKKDSENDRTKKDLGRSDLEDEKLQKDSKGVPPVILDDGDAELIRQSVVEYVSVLMDGDRKVTSLKQLQGHMWRKAYSSGEVVGEIYKDVLPAIKHWITEGKKAYIYSSGSVEAQKLLFSHTAEGDILEFISGHYDTKIGAKVEADSYRTIAKQINFETKEILFLSDVPREARPAKEAGCQVALVIRPGNAPLSDAELKEFKHVSSFAEFYSAENNEVVKKRKESLDDGENSS